MWYYTLVRLAGILFIFCIFLFSPSRVFAHLPGQEPFFKINTIYSPLYPVPSTSREDFFLPQDIAPELYSVNSVIVFEIDKNRLPMISQDALETMKFLWNFGDEQTAQGTMIEHTYKKMGSYFVTIYADDGINQPVLFQSTLVHIVPDMAYKLPRAIITVNGEKSTDSLVDPLYFSFDTMLLFDAQTSLSGSAPIHSYTWDFGDMQEGKKTTQKHLYNEDLRIVFPVLRIEDKNGFISDTFVQVNNDLYENEERRKNPNDTIFNPRSVFLVGFLILVVAVILGIFIAKAKKNKS